MRLNARRSLLLLAACAMSLASVLVYLYWMSRSDESGNYAQARDLIRQIKQYDAQWEGAVLKARTTTNYNYDPLVLPLIEMKRLCDPAKFPGFSPGCGRCNTGAPSSIGRCRYTASAQNHQRYLRLDVEQP